LMEQAKEAFGAGQREKGGREEEELLKKIGELTMERDFLARGLRGSR